MTDRHIDINVPVLARVEGEGALDMHIENGAITDLKLRIYEPPRYFEKFLEGRSYKEVTDTVARICGICPVAYQMSAVHAIEAIFEHTSSPWVRNMRRLMYCGEWLQSHSLHVHMLAAPDFLGFNSIIEMAQEYADEVRRGLLLQGLGNDLIRLLGGRSVHPVSVCAGGFYNAPDEGELTELLARFKQARQAAADLVGWTASLDLADDEQDFTSVSLRHADEYAMNAGRLVSDRGLDIAANEFDDHFRESHVPHSTALHCLLNDRPYLVGPLARLNNNLDRLPAESRALLDSTGITFPSRNMFHSIVARAIEIHFALNEAIDLMENYSAPERAHDELTVRAGVGFGCTEAPRGILWHRYELDDKGYVTSARIVPPTSQNQARIEQDIETALNHFGLDRKDSDLQLHAEKVIRNYDPCISCATHFLTLTVNRTTTKPVGSALLPDIVKPLTLVATGSPLPPDDLAWQVADRLQANLDTTELTVIKLDRPGTDLLRYLQQEGTTILLDTVISTETGNIIMLGADQLLQHEQALSSHDIDVASSLQLASSLGQSLSRVIVLAVPVTHPSAGNIAATTIDRYQQQICQLLQLT